jgi:hypothetical protein
MLVPCRSIHNPGAVPRGFSTTVAPRHHRLPTVDLRHRHPATFEPLTDTVDDRLVDVARHLSARVNVAGDVVFGRAKAAGADNEIDMADATFEDRCELRRAVADDRFQSHVAADRVQAFGNCERIRVDAKRREQFTADRDNPGLHGRDGIW